MTTGTVTSEILRTGENNRPAARGARLLLTGGRAPVTLDLARALHAGGHTVFIAESQSLHLTRSSRAVTRSFDVPAPNADPIAYVDALTRIVREERIHVLLPTCEEVFFMARGREALASLCRVWVDRPETLRTLHSKWEFMNRVRELGLPAPATRLARSVDEARAALLKAPGLRQVLKPEFSRFAARTRIGTGAELADQALELPISAGTPWVVQQCLAGPEYCTWSLAHEGRLIAHAAYSHEFTAGRGAGICFESVEIPAIEDWVRRFVAATGFTGQIAFDFIVTSDGTAYPLECNPRATSGLHLLAADPRLQNALLNPASVSETIRPAPGASAQIRLAMWAYGLRDVDSWARLQTWWRIRTRAREVVLDWRDPKPFFTQFAAFYGLLRDAKRLGISPLEASTRDIEWNGA
jgi:predicted ATP-grasp superfamily ATP-dependent carboligase